MSNGLRSCSFKQRDINYPRQLSEKSFSDRTLPAGHKLLLEDGFEGLRTFPENEYYL
jgi:hypothetical protein